MRGSICIVIDKLEHCSTAPSCYDRRMPYQEPSEDRSLELTNSSKSSPKATSSIQSNGASSYSANATVNGPIGTFLKDQA